MRRLLLILTLLATPALAQSNLPLLYTVTGVAANDTLNVRDSPNAGAPDVGDLQPNATVEIMRLSADGKWGLVETNDAVGWVSMRFMALTPNTTGNGTDLPSGLPRHITCNGAEPFWELTLDNGNNFSVGSDGPNDWEVRSFPVLGIDKGMNTAVDTYAFSSPPYTAVLKKEACFSDFTGLNHGWSMALVFRESQSFYVMSGCCTATLN